MSFKINSTRCIEMVKTIDKALVTIEELEKFGGKNKRTYPELKERLKEQSTLWKKGLDLENFDEWNQLK